MSIDEYREQIDKLREAVKDWINPRYGTDYDLLRWVKAWKGDMAKILPRFRRHMEVRKAYRMDEPGFGEFAPDSHEQQVFSTMSRAVFGVNKVSLDSRDQHGNVLIAFKLDNVDLGEIQKRVSCRDYLWFNLVSGEIARRHAANMEQIQGKPLGITFIEDLDGAQITKLIRDSMQGPARAAFWVMPDNQPEQANKFIIINAPMVVDVAINTVKPWLPPATREKFLTLRPDSSQLKELISGEFLPAEYGGSAPYKVPSPDAEFIKTIDLYPNTVPPDKMETLHLGRKQQTAYECPAGSTKVEWFFETNSPVLFSIVVKKPAVEKGVDNYLLAPLPADTTYMPEFGSLDLESEKIYEIKLDNYSTMLLSAKITYWFRFTLRDGRQEFAAF